MNPIAIVLMLAGLYLLVRGLSLYRTNKKTTGTMFSILGLVAILFPFAVSFFLGR